MLKHLVSFLLITLLLVSCKSKSVATTSIEAMSSRKVVKNHYENSFQKETINARLKAIYKDKETSQTITIKLRLEKDSVIWMSGTMLGIPLAKIMITPTKVQFYEKLGKTYFKGDFGLLSDFLGTDVDYNIIQNLLLGQALQNLKNDKYESVVNDNSYLVTPKNQEGLFDILFWIHPDNFKVSKQEIRQPKEQKKLTIRYSDYQEIEKETVPKRIDIIAVDKSTRTFIDLEYRSIEFDKKLSFPFKIPNGYQEIKLDE